MALAIAVRLADGRSARSGERPLPRQSGADFDIAFNFDISVR
jgi:hypothetical protein